jgi:hypothetical protein
MNVNLNNTNYNLLFRNGINFKIQYFSDTPIVSDVWNFLSQNDLQSSSCAVVSFQIGCKLKFLVAN